MRIKKLSILCIFIIKICICLDCYQICYQSPDSLDCQRCLILCHRTYQPTTKAYPCNAGFIQNIPVALYCCPKYCAQCAYNGCYSCKSSWNKYFDSASQIYNCTCKQNYYFNNTLDDCSCLATITTGMYYQPSPDLCQRCPEKCICNQNGCYQCQNTTNRQINLGMYRIYTCYCKYPLIQINRECSCYNNTSCMDDIYKLPDYIIILSNGQISCQDGYNITNNMCICQQPYYLNINNQCKCKSIINSTFYYQSNGLCYACPELCICNASGCISCTFRAYRQVYQFRCFCQNPRIQIQGKCVCIDPYDYTNCNCNSNNAPTLYFTDSLGICKYCPKGCNCDFGSCKNCDILSNRNDNCSCIYPIIEYNNQCILCDQLYTFVQNKCICPVLLDPRFYSYIFYDSDQITCKLCPNQCICNQSGCTSCKYSSRIYKLNSQNKFTCYCDKSKYFIQSSENCICMQPFVLDPSNLICICAQPYYFDQISQSCLCKSNQNSTLYYQYTYYDCRKCPIDCVCNQNGCVYCTTNTGRIIIYNSYTNITCPCRNNYHISNNKFCITCQIGFYNWNQTCIICNSECYTCNQLGCLSCSNSQYIKLNGTNCICTLSNFINVNGICLCQLGLYFLDGKCVVCPVNCELCITSTQYQNKVQCLLCNTSNFRQNLLNQSCPCIQYYQQNYYPTEYCCHWTCFTCDIFGCKTCPLFTNRILNISDKNNITCSCKQGFIQTYNYACTCPSGQFIFSDFCLPCSINCKTCQFVNFNINCTSCDSAMNRKLVSYTYNNLIYFDCSCQFNFLQVIPKQSYCYLQNCEQTSNPICAKCNQNRYLTRNNTYCQCLDGYFLDFFGKCQECNEGCINCTSKVICYQCSDGYFLMQHLETSCVKAYSPIKFNYVQTNEGFVVQVELIKVNGNFTYIFIQIQKIEHYNSNQILQPQILYLLDFDLIDRVVHAHLTYPNLNHINISILNVSLIYVDSDGKQTINQSYFLLLEHNLYNYLTLTFPANFTPLIYIVIVIFIIISFILYVSGSKQNQTIFYLQTIYFASLKISDKYLQIVPFLNFLRLTTYKYTQLLSVSPIHYAISDWSKYIQKSQGNYKFMTVDSNIIRNAGLPIFLSILVVTLYIISFILYSKIIIKKQGKLKNWTKKYKKYIYRTLVYIYKTTMYPVIYFSLQTVINHNQNISFIETKFYDGCYILSIFMLCFYTIITILQILTQISIINKYENTFQFIFDVITSLVIAFSTYSFKILILVLIFFLRGGYQIIILKLYKRNFRKITYCKIFLILCKIITVGLLYYNNFWGIFSIMILSVFLDLFTGFLIKRKQQIEIKYQKKFEVTSSVRSQEQSKIQMV